MDTVGSVSLKNISDELRNAIRFVKDDDELVIPDDAPLFGAGDEASAYQLDSLDVLELVLLCEERFGFMMSVNDISLTEQTTFRDVVEMVVEEMGKLGDVRITPP